MRDLEAGRLVVVGGHSRGVGKTALVEHILRAGPASHWVAVKISAHRHTPGAGRGALIERDRTGVPGTQTDRYLAAGAREAWLCHAADTDMADAARFIARRLAAGDDVIVESNRLVEYFTPATTLFVLSPPFDDWKPSSARAVRGADAFVLGPVARGIPAHWPRDADRLDGRPLFDLRAPDALNLWLATCHSSIAAAGQIAPLQAPA